MPQNLANAIAEGFSMKVIDRFLRASIAADITNNDYEGELKEGGVRRLRILTLGEVGLQSYIVGTDMVPANLTIGQEFFEPNRQRAFYFRIDSLEKFWSKIKDLDSKFTNKAGDSLKREVDEYVLGRHTEVKAGHRIGTDTVQAGNADILRVTITGATGAVVGVGTVFTAGMVGRGFRCERGSHSGFASTVWYRVRSVASATSMTISNWDDTLPLTDGSHGGTGHGYRVEATSSVTRDRNTIFESVDDLKVLLDDDEIPDEDRFLVVPPRIGALLRRSPELVPAIPAAYEDIRLKGKLGTISGFTTYETPRVRGNITDGWFVLAGTKDFITFAMSFVESKVEEDISRQFGKGYKGLTVYGGAVATERRRCGAYLHVRV